MQRLAKFLALASVVAFPALAEGRRDSACLAMSQGQARIIPAAFGAPLDQDSVWIRFLGHASFALESPGGQVAVTDYTGFIGNPDVVPDVVTMNIAHDTHFTETPDPRIPLVLRGWGDLGLPAKIDTEAARSARAGARMAIRSSSSRRRGFASVTWGICIRSCRTNSTPQSGGWMW
jgi:hypothetical protein